MKCKYCNTEILDKEYGFRDFHSECRKEFRRSYLRFKKRKSRKTANMMSTSYHLDVNKSMPTESTPADRLPEESETICDEFGGRAWYSLAKRGCCNFDVRLREGYCDKLFAPYYRYTCKCRECLLGKALMNKVKGKLKKAA